VERIQLKIRWGGWNIHQLNQADGDILSDDEFLEIVQQTSFSGGAGESDYEDTGVLASSPYVFLAPELVDSTV